MFKNIFHRLVVLSSIIALSMVSLTVQGASAENNSSPALTDNPPTVKITSPANGATVSGLVYVYADAQDDVAVTWVEFFYNSILFGVDTNGSDGWYAIWDSTFDLEGTYTRIAWSQIGNTNPMGRMDLL